MSEEAKRAIEILTSNIKKVENQWIIDEKDKGYLKDTAKSYQLAITAIQRNEAAIAECKGLLSEESNSREDYAIDELCEHILEILEGKQA